MLSNKEKILYFPFSPGIPWRFNKKFLINKIPDFVWSRFVKPRKNIIVSYGGLIESFFSLTLAEIFNFIYPDKQIYWCGYDKYKPLLEMNGLLKYNEYQIGDEIISGYNTPIFFDKEGDVYFNYLNNYLKTKSFDLQKVKTNKQPILQQIFSNSMMEWKVNFIPKIRNLNEFNFKKWASENKFYKNNPYIIIFPDKTELSVHKTKCLNWNVNKVKAISSILYTYGINTVIFSDNFLKYKNNNNYVLPVKLDLIFNLIKDCKLILSEDIDFLFISALISDAIIYSKKINSILSLEKNCSYLGINKKIFSSNLIEVSDILKVIKEN